MDTSFSAGMLTSEDYQAIQNILPALYEVGDLAVFPRRVMRVVAKLIPADSWAYEECNPFLGRAQGHTYPDDFHLTITADSVARFGELLPTHPVFRRWIAEGSMNDPLNSGTITPKQNQKPMRRGPLANSSALKISDLASCADLENSALYADVYRQLRIKDQLALLIAFPKPMLVAVGCDRDRRSFTERDRLMLNVLHPHLLTAYRNAEAFTSAQAVAQARRGRIATLTINSQRQVVAEEGPASALLADYFPRTAKRPPLPTSLTRWLGSILHDPSVPRVFTLRGSLGMLVMRVLNEKCADHLAVLLEEHLDDHTPPGTHPAEASLPPRLRQTLDALLGGKSTKEIAAELHISRHTASEHITRLYARFAVTTRGELLSLFVHR